MKTILTLLFCLAGLLAYAQAIHVGPSTEATGKAILEKHKADSVAALTIDYSLEPLTAAQEARLKEFDKAPEDLQANFKKAMDELQKQKIAYIIGIIEAQKKPVDMGKVKDFEHKPNQLILKVTK